MNKVRSSLFALIPLLALLLGGCSVAVVNQTPEIIPQNPSNLYTLTTLVNVDGTGVIKDTIRAHAVINGQTYPMTPVSPGSRLYAVDVPLPPDQAQAVYYFSIEYEVKSSQSIRRKTIKSDLHRFNLANRYIIQLQTDRAPVGSTIPVLGRGFSPSDTILVGEAFADTRFITDSLLQFVVPPLQAGQTYPVTWQSGLGNQIIGNFRVDPSNLIVRPDRIVIRSGQRAILVFQIDFDAPRGGLLVNDSTDVPQCVVMPEVVIPEGARSVNIPVEGAQPGNGNLFFNVGGMNEVVIPITVTAM